MTTIKNFCIENEIMWFPIKLIIGKDASGKTVKEVGEIRHPCYFNHILFLGLRAARI